MEPKSWRFGRWISLFISFRFSSPTLDQPWNLACSNLNSLLPPVISFLMSRSTWILKVDWIWFFHFVINSFCSKMPAFCVWTPKNAKCLEVRPSRPSWREMKWWVNHVFRRGGLIFYCNALLPCNQSNTWCRPSISHDFPSAKLLFPQNKCHCLGCGLWFPTFVIYFTPTWGNDPIWLIFFKWVETTD